MLWTVRTRLGSMLVEQFKIAVEPRNDGALLRLSWDVTT